MLKNKLRSIAFYLPQYHPIPENDEWWGKGFTEWTNVTKAKPIFRDHYQPHLPADLGYYDLRLPEVRQAQAELAKEYGIGGFCYYHYWFSGKRLLERPFNEVLASGKPDFPFCLCWANESWSRRWDGQETQVLTKQTYDGVSDTKNHIHWLIKAFKDPRYIRINDKPLFLIYRAKEIPELERMIVIWREEAEKAGLTGLYLCSVDSSWARNWNPTPYGFEASVEFQPAFTLIPEKFWIDPQKEEQKVNLFSKIQNKIQQKLFLNTHQVERPKHKIISYDVFVRQMLKRKYDSYKMFRCVTPGFDNTSRRVNLPISMLQQSNPEDFGFWLREVVKWTETNMEGEEQIVFINAWNEWAEGNHLEPDQKFGCAFLEQVREIMTENSEKN